MTNDIYPYLVVSSILFAIGLSIVISKKNLVLMLMGVELMLNAANINFVVFSKKAENWYDGHLFSIFIMIIAAAEIAIGLAIILKIKKYYENIDPDVAKELHG